MGLEEDKRLGMNNGPVSLTRWINIIRTYLEECGMDTVFIVWDLTINKEVYILDEWGEDKRDCVVPWVNALKSGIGGATECHYDLYNLRWRVKALLRSVSRDVWVRIEKELPTFEEPSGPEIFCTIVSHVQQVNSSSVRQMVGDLEKIILKEEGGKDVLVFGDKVLELL